MKRSFIIAGRISVQLLFWTIIGLLIASAIVLIGSVSLWEIPTDYLFLQSFFRAWGVLGLSWV